MMVRAAVLKMKDPRQIIRDMEKLDEMGKDPFMWDTTKENSSTIMCLIMFL